MTRTAARFGSSFSVVSGWSMFVELATAVITRVISSAYGLDAATRCWALEIRDAATSSIARVIFLVDCTDWMRRRYSRRLPDMSALVGVGVAAGVRVAAG